MPAAMLVSMKARTSLGRPDESNPKQHRAKNVRHGAVRDAKARLQQTTTPTQTSETNRHDREKGTNPGCSPTLYSAGEDVDRPVLLLLRTLLGFGLTKLCKRSPLPSTPERHSNKNKPDDRCCQEPAKIPPSLKLESRTERPAAYLYGSPFEVKRHVLEPGVGQSLERFSRVRSCEELHQRHGLGRRKKNASHLPDETGEISEFEREAGVGGTFNNVHVHETTKQRDGKRERVASGEKKRIYSSTDARAGGNGWQQALTTAS